MKKMLLVLLGVMCVVSSAFAYRTGTKEYKIFKEAIYEGCLEDDSFSTVKECECISVCMAKEFYDDMTEDDAFAIGVKCGFKCS